MLAGSLLLTTCKNPRIDYESFSITKEIIKPETRKVVISGEYDLVGEVSSMKLNMGQNEQLIDAESYLMNIDSQSFSVTVDSLSAGSLYYYCYVVEFIDGYKMLTEIGEFTTLSEKPLVKTLEITAVDATSFMVKCLVEDDFGSAITERGIYWNTDGNPGINDHKVKHEESGVGEYVCKMENLEPNMTYYVRAYAKNEKGLSYANEVLHFQTMPLEIPTVETLSVEDITQTTAVCWGKIVNEGSSAVNQRYGIRLGTTSDFSIDGALFSGNSDGDCFYVNFTDLLPNTTYYYCAYAVNDEGACYGDTLDFQTLSLDGFSIDVSCSPSVGGQVEGGGEFVAGEICTLMATANDHYEFRDWTEGGDVVFERALYFFAVDRNRTLVANFTLMKYIISATSNPINGGIVDGVGEYEYNHICELKAIPYDGYCFKNWTDTEGNFQSKDNPYTITVTNNMQLVANFTQVPEGGINALFSVGPSSKVFFSRGNLQYRASDHIFRFAENQWVRIGEDNSNISNNYNGWIDLFGWGTGNEPTNTGTVNVFEDWGENAIENGGNTPGLWRTMTQQEWEYVINQREASTIEGVENARYVKAKVYNVRGIVLFPDTFENPNEIEIKPNTINNPFVSFDNNDYLGNQWSVLEEKGCVFLPVTGKREDTIVDDLDNGYYWSSTYGVMRSAYGLHFNGGSLQTDLEYAIKKGESVRLVQDCRRRQ